MSNTIKERLFICLDDEANEFNSLPYEERKRIIRYTSATQMLTIYQCIENNKDLTTERWRKAMWNWIRTCVEWYERDYLFNNDEMKGE